MEQHTLKNVSNCLNTNIYSYLETSGVNVIKLFSFIADDEAKSARVSSRPDWKGFKRTNPLVY